MRREREWVGEQERVRFRATALLNRIWYPPARKEHINSSSSSDDKKNYYTYQHNTNSMQISRNRTQWHLAATPCTCDSLFHNDCCLHYLRLHLSLLRHMNPKWIECTVANHWSDTNSNWHWLCYVAWNATQNCRKYFITHTVIEREKDSIYRKTDIACTLQTIHIHWMQCKPLAIAIA